MSELSEKAKKICKINYKNNCGGCVLRPECPSSIGSGLKALKKYTLKVNAKAEIIQLQIV